MMHKALAITRYFKKMVEYLLNTPLAPGKSLICIKFDGFTEIKGSSSRLRLNLKVHLTSCLISH